MISEFLCVAFDCAKPEKKQTESGTRTAQSIVLTNLDHDNAAA
jgi:hypothetical protein